MFYSKKHNLNSPGCIQFTLTAGGIISSGFPSVSFFGIVLDTLCENNAISFASDLVNLIHLTHVSIL